MQPLRGFFAASIFVLGCGSAPMQAGIDPAMLALVPPDIKVLGGIQVRQSLTTPFGQFLISQVPKNSGIEKFAAASGFDFKRDLTEILVGSLNPSGGAGSNDRNLVIARGTFDVPKILTLNALTGGAATVKQGVQWVTPAQGPAGQSMAFLSSSLLVAGPEDMIEAAIARNQPAPDAAAAPSALLQRALDASAANDIWFVSATPLSEMLPKGNTPVPMAAFDSIMGYTGGLHLDDTGVTFSGEVQTRTDQDAQALALVMKFAAGMARAPQALPLDKIVVEASGSVLRLKLNLPEAQMEQLLQPGVRTQKIVAQ